MTRSTDVEWECWDEDGESIHPPVYAWGRLKIRRDRDPA